MPRTSQSVVELKKRLNAGKRLDPIRSRGSSSHPRTGSGRTPGRSSSVDPHERGGAKTKQHGAHSDAPRPYGSAGQPPHHDGHGSGVRPAPSTSRGASPSTTPRVPSTATRPKLSAPQAGRGAGGGAKSSAPTDSRTLPRRNEAPRAPSASTNRNSVGHHSHDDSKPRRSSNSSSASISAGGGGGGRSAEASAAHQRSTAVANGVPSSTRGKLAFSSGGGFSAPASSAGEANHDAERGRLGQGSTNNAARTTSKGRSSSSGGISNGTPARRPTSSASAATAAAHKTQVASSSSKPIYHATHLAFMPNDNNATFLKNRSNWRRDLPATVAALLDGNVLEPPFTTALWKQAYDEPAEVEDDRTCPFLDDDEAAAERHRQRLAANHATLEHEYPTKIVDGYYACIRCNTPICDPEYQVLNPERGIASFKYLNSAAVEVQICMAADAHHSLRGQRHCLSEADSTLHFSVRCAHCSGCVGQLSLDVPLSLMHEVESGELFYANSACLRHINFRTHADLRGVVVGNSDGPNAAAASDEEEDVMDLNGGWFAAERPGSTQQGRGGSSSGKPARRGNNDDRYYSRDGGGVMDLDELAEGDGRDGDYDGLHNMDPDYSEATPQNNIFSTMGCTDYGSGGDESEEDG